MNYIWGTGFEMGSVAVWDWIEKTNAFISTVHKTGTYSMRIRGTNMSVRKNISDSPDELYAGMWAYPHWVRVNVLLIKAHIDSGHYVSVRFDHIAKTYDAYVNGVKVADGTQVVTNTFNNVQCRFLIANSGGRIQTKINGILDIDYTGDTQPGGSTAIDYFELDSPGDADSTYIDDLILADDWPGDVRFEALVPEGDNSVQWEPSAGSDNYAMVDEIGPSDADYVRASGTAFVDKYDLEDWVGAGKGPVLIMLWARAWKEVADLSQLIILIDDGTEAASAALDLDPVALYYPQLFQQPPSGGLWDESKVNILLIGVQSVIP